MVDDWCCYGGDEKEFFCRQKGGVFPSDLYDLGVGFWEYLFDLSGMNLCNLRGEFLKFLSDLGLEFCFKRMPFFFF